MKGYEQAMDVEDGQRMQQDVVGLPLPCFEQRTCVRSQVPVCDHGTLGLARGARGVEHGGEIGRVA